MDTTEKQIASDRILLQAATKSAVDYAQGSSKLSSITAEQALNRHTLLGNLQAGIFLAAMITAFALAGLSILILADASNTLTDKLLSRIHPAAEVK